MKSLWLLTFFISSVIPATVFAENTCLEKIWNLDDLDSPMTFENSAGAQKGWQYMTAYTSPALPTPSKALYYGSLVTGNYNFGTNYGQATTSEIPIPSETHTKLFMRAMLFVEATVVFDRFTVTASDEKGKRVTVFQKSENIVGAWKDVEADLTSFAGKKITITFDFATIDGTGNEGRGIYVSDLKILSHCEAR